MTALERAHLNVEADLKSTETQAENQRKQLHITEIKLATQRQLVLDLKVELQKAKDATRVSREAFEAVKVASYERGWQETETRLTEEVAGVCRDYCAKTWAKALNRAGVFVDSELRKVKNIFFPKDIREAPTMLPPPVANPLSPPDQLPTTQAPPPNVEVSIKAGKGREA